MYVHVNCSLLANNFEIIVYTPVIVNGYCGTRASVTFCNLIYEITENYPKDFDIITHFTFLVLNLHRIHTKGTWKSGWFVILVTETIKVKCPKHVYLESKISRHNLNVLI